MPLSRFLAIAASLIAIAATKLPAQATTPRETVDWLRVLALDARIAYQLSDGAAEPDLFHVSVPDGRLLIDYIAEELGSGGAANWTVIDEGVGSCLAEAEKLKALAAAADDDSPEQAALNVARKRFLEGSALLLDAYRGAAGGVFDENVSGGVDLPDWALPGEIQIKEAAGAAQINVATKEFGGRLSGEVSLPKFDANFAVPNASFDSRGNIDLTAYGSAAFPPDSPDKVTLSVPKRRPLILHLSDDGDFRIAGSGRVKLPDGNQFEAHFDADHPMYEFGLAYAGNLTLQFAKEVTLLRPSLDPATIYEPGAIIGLGQFYGSLGKGYESFMEDSPELPSLDDLNIGVAPEFKAPETVVPFDVFSAWAVGLVNDDVRPLVNGSYEASLKSARKQIRTLRDSVRSAQSEIAPTLEQIRKLRRNLEQLAKARKALEDAEAAAELGDDAVVSLEDVIGATEQAAEIAEDYMENTPASVDFKTGFAVVELWLNAKSTAQGTGSEIGIDLGAALPKIDQWTDNAFGQFGFDQAGNVVDQARVDTLQPADLRVLAWALLELEARRQGLGEDTTAGVYFTFLDREFQMVNALYQDSIVAGNIEARAQYAAHLHDLMVVAGQTGFTDDPVKLGAMFAARDDTIGAIASAGGDTPEQQSLAQKIFFAGQELVDAQNRIVDRRVDDLLGNRAGANGQEKKDLALRANLGAGNHGFFSQWYFAMKAFSDDGTISASQRADYETSLAGLMRYYADTQIETFSDVTKIEQNLEGAFDALVVMLDLLAIAEDMVPDDTELIGELQANWQALHVPWIGVAEAKRASFYLSAYSVEIGNATERYGDGMSAALKASVRAAGNEAVRGLSRVVDYLAGVVNGFALEDFDFKLPGDMQIQRAFGVLKFDVAEEPPSWDFEFGGQLYFSDYDLTFAVPSAHIFSDGMFDVSLMTEGPVPFGFEETMRLSTAFSLSGNVLTPAINSASAMGDLIYTPEDGGMVETFTGTLNYRYQDGHFFAFETGFDATRQLFTEEVAIFEGGFGFALSTDALGNPQQGNVSADIELGLLLREDADLTTLEEADYWLKFAGSAEVDFSVTERMADFRLLSGTMTLPPDIFSDEDAAASATITLDSVICVRVDFENQTIAWCDEAGQTVLLSANNIHAVIPGLDGSDLEITSAQLRLSGTEFPVLASLDATLEIPLPGYTEGSNDRLAQFDINGEDWRIDGFPKEATIALTDDLRLVDFNGLTIEVLGGPHDTSGNGQDDCLTTFSLSSEAGVPTFAFNGGLGVVFDDSLMRAVEPDGSVGGAASALACGSFEWTYGQQPVLNLGTAEIAGRFRIGGESGVGLEGIEEGELARLRFIGLDNLFRLSPARTFEIAVEGAIEVSDLMKFGLYETRFIWDGSALLPVFQPGGGQVELGEGAIELADGLLPVYPTKMGVKFKNNTLPLLPGAGEMGLFDPLNVTVIVSGIAALPAGSAAIDAGSPGISGMVNDLEIELERRPDGLIYPVFNIDTIVLELNNLELPPLGGISGGLAVGNLSAVADGRPEDIYFAGSVGAKIKDIGASALIAAKPLEMLGACFELSAGPAGIPIDGGFLGGVLLTGGSGGISYLNNFGDPCEFSTYIKAGTDVPPRGDRPGSGGEPELLEVVEWDGATLNCVRGTFPPQSINPLCQPHPTPSDPERVIYKETNLSAQQLAQLGITASTFNDMSVAEAVDHAIGILSADFQGAVDIVKQNVSVAGDALGYPQEDLDQATTSSVA